MTVGAYDFSVSDEQKALFLVSVSDCSVCESCAGARPSPDAPSLTQAIIVQMVYFLSLCYEPEEALLPIHVELLSFLENMLSDQLS